MLKVRNQISEVKIETFNKKVFKRTEELGCY